MRPLEPRGRAGHDPGHQVGAAGGPDRAHAQGLQLEKKAKISQSLRSPLLGPFPALRWGKVGGVFTGNRTRVSEYPAQRADHYTMNSAQRASSQ